MSEANKNLASFFNVVLRSEEEKTILNMILEDKDEDTIIDELVKAAWKGERSHKEGGEKS